MNAGAFQTPFLGLQVGMMRVRRIRVGLVRSESDHAAVTVPGQTPGGRARIVTVCRSSRRLPARQPIRVRRIAVRSESDPSRLRVRPVSGAASLSHTGLRLSASRAWAASGQPAAELRPGLHDRECLPA